MWRAVPARLRAGRSRCAGNATLHLRSRGCKVCSSPIGAGGALLAFPACRSDNGHPMRTLSWPLPMLSSTPKWARGAAVAILAFGALGTVSALWSNPLFMRMTPAGGWEIALLGVLSALLGLYVAIRRPACANQVAGAGGVLGVLGVACPICNKILVLLVGGEVLLTYFEPIRIYVAAAGAVVVAAAVILEWRHRRGLLLTTPEYANPATVRETPR
jgi:hypothetical protein